jgi:hypothetical protein
LEKLLEQRKQRRWSFTASGIESEEMLPSNTMLMHELKPDHQLRNTKIAQLSIKIVCRHTKSKRDPSTWKIKNNTYNELNESWQNNFDWVVTETK